MEQTKDIVNLKPAPGNCVAVYLTVGKCKLPLACMPTDPRLKEAIKAREAARKASKKNRSYVEDLDHILVQQEDKKMLGLTPPPERY